MQSALLMDHEEKVNNSLFYVFSPGIDGFFSANSPSTACPHYQKCQYSPGRGSSHTGPPAQQRQI